MMDNKLVSDIRQSMFRAELRVAGWNIGTCNISFGPGGRGDLIECEDLSGVHKWKLAVQDEELDEEGLVELWDLKTGKKVAVTTKLPKVKSFHEGMDDALTGMFQLSGETPYQLLPYQEDMLNDLPPNRLRLRQPPKVLEISTPTLREPSFVKKAFDHSPAAPKFKVFVEALEALCIEHHVTLSTSGYDALQVWDFSERDGPVYDNGIEDHTNPQGETAMISRQQLSNIVPVPDGATSFHTEADKIVFIVGATGTLVETEIDAQQTASLRELALTGTFGQQIAP